VADHHAALAVEAGHAADDGVVVGEAAVAVQLLEIRKHMGRIVQRVRALGVPGHLGDLPGRELGVDVLLQSLALGLQAGDLLGNVHRRVVLDEAKLLDLLLQFGDRLFKVEEDGFHASFRIMVGGHSSRCRPAAKRQPDCAGSKGQPGPRVEPIRRGRR